MTLIKGEIIMLVPETIDAIRATVGTFRCPNKIEAGVFTPFRSRRMDVCISCSKS